MAIHHFKPTAWHNVLGTLPPVLTVESGDTIVAETLDANGYDADGVQRTQPPNPMTGPFFVNGAEPGDALAVRIDALVPSRASGWTRGALAQHVVDPDRVETLPPRDKIFWHLDRNAGTARLETPTPNLSGWEIPFEPMIGCFGVAPALGQAFSTATSAENGGNMDYRRLGPGTTVWFPVAVSGALFFLGDGHARQGDGEIVGTGIETSFEMTVTLSVVKNRKQRWPRGEDAETIFAIGNARPLDQALQHATTEMLDWLTSDHGLGIAEASHVLGQCVRYDIGNVYDPAYTVACVLEKRWLPKR